MNLHHLKVFHVAAEVSSISLAAERLFISQPAVTREIRELESALGIILFNRLPRGVSLTEGGQLLAQFASRIFALERAAEMEMRALAGLTAGELRLGASATLGTYFLPVWVSKFHSLYPHIEINLLIMNSREIEGRLLNHDFTIGFAEGPFNQGLFSFEPMGRDNIVAVAHPTHPLTKKKKISAVDLIDRVIIMHEAGSGIRTTIENTYRAVGLSIQAMLSAGSTEAIKRIILTDGGAAWVPEQAVIQELQGGMLVQLNVCDLQIERQLHLIWPKGQILSPSAKAFRQLILGTTW